MQNQTKLSYNKEGPFPIIRRHGKLAYEIKLPDYLKKIHPIISIEHLEPAPQDPYNRDETEPGPIMVDGEARYIIEKILARGMRVPQGTNKQEPHYLIKWLDHREMTWEPVKNIRKQTPLLARKYEEQRALERRRSS